MEKRNDDLGNENDLPAPGTEEPESATPPEAPGGSAGEGPGNVSVDEPTAAALDPDAGIPGGAEADGNGSAGDSEDDSSEDEAEHR